MRRVKVYKRLIWAVLFLTLASTLIFVRPVSSQSALQTIFIQPNGSIYPDTAPIHRSGDTYTFTDNINAAIKIQKSNIVLDGAGYTLTGSFNGNSSDIWVVGTGPDNNSLDYYTIGVDLSSSSVDGVTIENLNVENFSIGMYIWTQNNTVTGNAVSGNIVGLLISGSNDTITKNYLSNNIEGLFFGFNSPSGQFPPDMIVYHNAFVKNKAQISGCQCKSYNMSETPHDWDNGKEGNYWSDYNGTDANHDGIGDTPYVIDVLDQDRYPLMQNPTKPPVPASKVPVEAIVLAISAPAVLAAAAVFAVKQRRKLKVSSKGKDNPIFDVQMLKLGKKL
jgi:hypothetical protein